MSTQTAVRRPLTVDDLLPRPRPRPRDFLHRAAECKFLARADPMRFASAEAASEMLYPGDKVVPLMLRTPSAPAMTNVPGWAAELVDNSVADFIGGLHATSAASTVFAAGVMLNFGRSGLLTMPNVATASGDAGGFVIEGGPISVRQLTVDGVLLTPKKIATISVLSIELSKASGGTVNRIIETVLSEAAALALDTELFSTTAASTLRPAGILNGVTPLTASTATPASEAMAEDIGALGAAVAGIAGSGAIIFIASPAQALRMRLAAGAKFTYEILASSALAAGTVVAIAPRALVSAFESSPKFSTADQATLVMDDAATALGTVGSPNTIGGSVKSLWQSGLIGLRMILPCSWGLRASGAVAVVHSVLW